MDDDRYDDAVDECYYCGGYHPSRQCPSAKTVRLLEQLEDRYAKEDYLYPRIVGANPEEE